MNPNASNVEGAPAVAVQRVVRRHRPWWVKERHNPQLGTYHVACGQMSKTAARKAESSLYGYNIMRPFDTEKEYTAHLEYLREKGERVQ